MMYICTLTLPYSPLLRDPRARSLRGHRNGTNEGLFPMKSCFLPTVATFFPCVSHISSWSKVFFVPSSEDTSIL